MHVRCRRHTGRFSVEKSSPIWLSAKELGYEAYRHYKRTVRLFDDYLCRIGRSKKEIPEPVIEDWIREVSIGISVNTAGQHIHHIRQLLLYLTNCGFHCFIPRVGEALNIKVSDIDFQRKLIFLRMTKKCKQCLIPFGDELALNTWNTAEITSQTFLRNLRHLPESCSRRWSLMSKRKIGFMTLLEDYFET